MKSKFLIFNLLKVGLLERMNFNRAKSASREWRRCSCALCFQFSLLHFLI